MFFYDSLTLGRLPDMPGEIERVHQIFLEETAQRAKVRLRSGLWDGGRSTILIDTRKRLEQYAGSLFEKLENLAIPGTEGFQLLVDAGERLIVVAGADERGCMYGMGRLLRKSYLKNGRAGLSDSVQSMSSTPRHLLRGHQFGFRDKQNTCPCWTNEDFDRYIRDMAIFGNNAAELVPPRTDDALFSPAFHQDPMRTMADWSEIIHSYGMDVWVWYPNMGKDYNKPETRAAEAKEREQVFSQVPYVDAVLIPTGDPGELKPRQFFEVTGEAVRILHKYHPRAKVYVSPQGLRHTGGEFEVFYEEVAKQPDWLYGLCFAPWNRDTVEEMRQKVPAVYRDRIRFYPDITHNASSQYEIPDWDIAFALSQGRESYSCRPRAMKHIQNLIGRHTCGSVTYSEGIHDDVNKIVWADQEFDPGMDCRESVEDYVRFFIDPDLTEPLSDMLMNFEESWTGDIEKNTMIDRQYDLFCRMERSVCEAVRSNYRFKMAYLRALSDYQTKRRAIRDRALQREAEQVLGRVRELGADETIFRARNILNRTFTEPVCYRLTQEMFRLGEELFNTPGCRIKLSSKYYMGQSWIRGAWLDCAELPLNDYQWYMSHFKRVKLLDDEEEKRSRLEGLLNRKDPGPGGFYFCMGDAETLKRHLRSGKPWEEDPGFQCSPRITYDLYGIVYQMMEMRGWYDEFPITLDWIKRVRAMYFTPLVLEFPELDTKAGYKLRVTYSEQIAPRYPGKDVPVALYAGDRLLHHKLCSAETFSECPVYEYSLPKQAYEDGTLRLSWFVTGTQRSVSISEIWIIKEPEGIRA